MRAARAACKAGRNLDPLPCAPVAAYADSQSVLDARRAYFDANAFGADGGYAKHWVKVKLGPLPIWFPNSPGRVRAVRYHDLHHVATGYETDWVGEGEIGAWEVASGCRGFFAAWVLNLLAMALGSVLSFERLFCAFVRGRYSRNLYGDAFDDALLATSVGALRHRLGLDQTPPAPTAADRLAFAGWYAAALCTYALVSALVLAPLVLLVAWPL
jgi:hypothetical protein